MTTRRLRSHLCRRARADVPKCRPFKDLSVQSSGVLFLIDSNIAIASDPLSHKLEPVAESAMQFLRLATTHHMTFALTRVRGPTSRGSVTRRSVRLG